jgi:hypothetical protein
VKAKIIVCTSTISVRLSKVQHWATVRIENKIDTGFAEMVDNFNSIRKAICKMVLKEHRKSRNGSTTLLLSLSTYAGNDKNVWREFRHELFLKGFRSKNLDRHKDLIMAYILKLEQSGALDQLQDSLDPEIGSPGLKQAVIRTGDSLNELQLIKEEEPESELLQKQNNTQIQKSSDMTRTKTPQVASIIYHHNRFLPRHHGLCL